MKTTDQFRLALVALFVLWNVVRTPLPLLAQSITPPKIIHLEPLVVPSDAIPPKRQPDVKVLINADGTARLADPTIDELWTPIIEKALRRSRFKPATRNGTPAAALVKVRFSISESASNKETIERPTAVETQQPHEPTDGLAPVEDVPAYSSTARIDPVLAEVGLTDTVSSEYIDKTHPASTDEVLRLVPGVNIVQHGSEGKGHQILIRGFDAAHGSDVEVLLEGISVNEPSNVHGQGYLDLYGIIPETVLEMKTAKGPFLPWQANFGMAGSLRFRLGVPAEYRPGFIRMEADQRNRVRAVAVLAPKEMPQETFFATEAVSDPGFGPDRRARRASLTMGYRLQLNTSDALTSLVSGQTARFESPGALRLSDVREKGFDFYDTYLQGGEGLSDKLLAKLGFEHKSKNTFVELFIYGIARDFELQDDFTGWLMNEEHGDARLQKHEAGTTGGAFHLRQALPTPFRSDFLAGAGWRIDAIDQNESQVDLNGVAWRSNRNLNAALQYAPFYLAVSFSPLDWIKLTPSMRFDLFFYDVEEEVTDRSVAETLVVLSPKLAANFPVDEMTTLFAGYGQGFRSPEARAVAAPPQESIEDERLSQYTGGEAEITKCDAAEAGLELKPIDMIDLKLTGFATWLEHEMVFDHVSNTNLELDGTRRLGVEFAATLGLGSWLTAGGEITFVDARFNRSGNSVPGAPQWLGTFRLFLGAEKGPQGGTRLFWVGDGRPLAHGATADGYIQLDVDAGWRFENLAITAIFNNVFDTEIMEGVYHFASWFDRTEQRSLIPEIHFVAAEPFTFRLLFTAYL